jgi:hypothetical protein
MGCWLGTARLFDLYGLLQALNAVICEAGCFLVAFSKGTLAGCLDIAQVAGTMAERATPPGPSTSTTRRLAR